MEEQLQNAITAIGKILQDITKKKNWKAEHCNIGGNGDNIPAIKHSFEHTIIINKMTIFIKCTEYVEE